MSAPRVEHLSDSVTLYLGDCREILPTLGKVDAVVTDPPYGIGFNWKNSTRNGRKSFLDWGGASLPDDPQWSNIVGDDAPFDPAPWISFKHVILWGGNNYAGLPPARCWLIWDKRCGSSPDDFGDAEMAWTNLDQVIRIHRQLWRGIIRSGEENVSTASKYHPTQKPAALMCWCLEQLPEDADVTLDPFMGSGTTGVACARLGRKFIGIEIEPKYFDIACKRIGDELKQPRLFTEAPKPATQEAMF